MVLLHVSFNTEEFLFEAKGAQNVGEVISEVATIHNLRLRVRRLVGHVGQLIRYGPMKEEKNRGFSEEEMKLTTAERESKFPHSDPLGNREGKPVPAEYAKTLERVCSEAEACISNKNVAAKVAASLSKIQERLQNIKGAVMMAFPMGLPEWDPVLLGIEDKEDLSGSEDGKYVMEPETCLMWFAGSQMIRENTLLKHAKMEKATLKVKLTRKGAGPPSREPAVDADTQKAMMAHWHKKQQEEKELAEDTDSSFMNSSWADPKAFKNGLVGAGAGIRYR